MEDVMDFIFGYILGILSTLIVFAGLKLVAIWFKTQIKLEVAMLKKKKRGG